MANLPGPVKKGDQALTQLKINGLFFADSMTGASIKTPTTVAGTAPEERPKSMTKNNVLGTTNGHGPTGSVNTRARPTTKFDKRLDEGHINLYIPF